MIRSIFLLIFTLGFLSCTTKHAQKFPQPNRQIIQLGEEYFNFILEEDPLYASQIGKHHFDNLLPKIDRQSRNQRTNIIKNFQKRIFAIKTDNLSISDQTKLSFLQLEITTLLNVQVCRFSEWLIDQLDGPQINLAEIPKAQKLESDHDFENLLSRYKQIHNYFLTHVTNLESGLNSGLIAARINIQHVINQIQSQLIKSPKDSPYMISTHRFPNNWSNKKQNNYRQKLIRAIKFSIYPGLRAYKEFLENQLLPKARTIPGIANLSIGAQCYQTLIKRHTGLHKTPEEIHELGLNEVSRIQRAIKNLIHDSDLSTHKKILFQDPKQYLNTPEELVKHNQDLVLRAQKALPMAFNTLPKTPIKVQALEEYRAKSAPVAYYQQAPPDGRRPAIYFLNTRAPKTRPLFNMAALAFHEAVPGHHLQISLANENNSIPEFQRHLGQTAYIEGWALYAEILSRELGLYQNQAELFGSLNYELWRALRLVIDTGLHHLGWTREQAANYLAHNTAFTKEEVYNEIDRYIVWPGQALAYKIGQLEISYLRSLCETKLKSKFSLGRFHSQVLKHGAMPLSALRKNIFYWLKQQQTES